MWPWLFTFLKKKWFIFISSVFCLHLCSFIASVAGACWGRKRASVSQVVVRCHVVAENWTPVLSNGSKYSKLQIHLSSHWAGFSCNQRNNWWNHPSVGFRRHTPMVQQWHRYPPNRTDCFRTVARMKTCFPHVVPHTHFVLSNHLLPLQKQLISRDEVKPLSFLIYLYVQHRVSAHSRCSQILPCTLKWIRSCMELGLRPYHLEHTQFLIGVGKISWRRREACTACMWVWVGEKAFLLGRSC